MSARDHLDEVEAREEVQDFITGLRKQNLIQPLQHRKSFGERAREGAAGGLIPGVIRLIALATRNPRGKVR